MNWKSALQHVLDGCPLFLSIAAVFTALVARLRKKGVH